MLKQLKEIGAGNAIIAGIVATGAVGISYVLDKLDKKSKVEQMVKLLESENKDTALELIKVDRELKEAQEEIELKEQELFEKDEEMAKLRLELEKQMTENKAIKETFNEVRGIMKDDGNNKGKNNNKNNKNSNEKES